MILPLVPHGRKPSYSTELGKIEEILLVEPVSGD